MPHLCEITLKRYRRNGLPPSPGKKSESRKPELLKRKIEIKELKESVRLSISPEGLDVLKKAGGLARFLKDREDKKLSTKLIRIKRKLYGEPKGQEKKEEEKAEAKEPEKKAEEKKAEVKEEKPEEKQEAKAEEKKEEKAEPKKEEQPDAKKEEKKAKKSEEKSEEKKAEPASAEAPADKAAKES